MPKVAPVAPIASWFQRRPPLVLVLAAWVVSAGVQRRWRTAKYTREEYVVSLDVASAQMDNGADVTLSAPANAATGQREANTKGLHDAAVEITECSKDGRATCWSFGKKSLPSLILIDRAKAWLRYVATLQNSADCYVFAEPRRQVMMIARRNKRRLTRRALGKSWMTTTGYCPLTACLSSANR